MTTLISPRVAETLDWLHAESEAADSAHFGATMAQMEAAGVTAEQWAQQILADERVAYRSVYRDYADNFLAVSPRFGRFLYMIARARRATRIVEFGTSMGVSTVYLAAALHDTLAQQGGSGRLIGSELEPAKAARARRHLETAGLADLVEIREGDALETLRDLEGPIDLLLLDGAFSLYLPVLKLVEPRLATGAIVIGENAFDPAYLDHVRDPANGYLSQPLPVDEGRGNEFSVVIR